MPQLLTTALVILTLVSYVWIRHIRIERKLAREEIVKRLGAHGDKVGLISGRHIRQARKFLRSRNDFRVIYHPVIPRRWGYTYPSLTCDPTIDMAIGMRAQEEIEMLDGLGEITEETLKAHPEISEWGQWTTAIPEH